VTDTRPARWESGAEWPLTAAAVAFLAAYAWPILNPTIGRGWHALCNNNAIQELWPAPVTMRTSRIPRTP